MSARRRKRYKYITKPPKGFGRLVRRPRRLGDNGSDSSLIVDARDQAQRGNCHHALRLLTQAAACGSGVSDHEVFKARSFIAGKCLRK